MSDVEKTLAKMTVETLKADFQQTQKQNKQIMMENLREWHNQTKKIQKKRGEIIQTLRKTIKRTLKDEKKKQKETQKQEKKIKNVLILKNEWMKNVVSTYSDKIDQQITQLKRENTAAAWNKIQEKEKEKEKDILKRVKAEEKERTARRKEMIRQTKKTEREKTKAEKEQIRVENKVRKEAIRKTRKLRVK